MKTKTDKEYERLAAGCVLADVLGQPDFSGYSTYDEKERAIRKFYGARIRKIMKSNYAGNDVFQREVAACFWLVHWHFNTDSDFLKWARKCSGFTDEKIRNYLDVCERFLYTTSPESVFASYNTGADFRMDQLIAMKELSCEQIQELMNERVIDYFSRPDYLEMAVENKLEEQAEKQAGERKETAAL